MYYSASCCIPLAFRVLVSPQLGAGHIRIAVNPQLIGGHLDAGAKAAELCGVRIPLRVDLIVLTASKRQICKPGILEDPEWLHYPLSAASRLRLRR